MTFNRKHFSKPAISVILVLCMLLSCVYVGLVPTDAARVESGSSGSTITNIIRVKFHANLTGYDDSGNALSAWSDWSMSAVDSNHYIYTVYTAASQSEKNFGWHVGGSNWGDSWYTMNGEHFTANETCEKTKDFTKNGSNDKVSTISASSGWVKLQVDWYGDYSNSSYVKFYQTAVSELSSTVEVGKTALQSGQTTTISSSSSGGTGTPTNSIKVYQGSSSGTDVTSSVLSGTTFTAPTVTSSTTYFVINTATDATITSYKKDSAAKTITVTPAEPTYSVSVESEDTSKGTVEAATVSAGATTAVTIPKATPKYGYVFDKWVADSPASIVANETNAETATVKATGTGGKVRATFKPNTALEFYVAGRFQIYDGSNWVYSFDSGDWSTTGDDNIRFTYDSGTTYKLETNASIAKLSEQISSINPYFFIYDKTNQKPWHPTSGSTLTESTKTATLSTNTETHNVRFNSTSTDTPVTLYFNAATKELRYEVPDYYTISCTEVTGGSVTSDPERQKQGQTVTLNITPATGYQLSTITAKDASNNTVALSGTGSTRTFSVPASNVTVTATFSKIGYTLTKASATNGSFTLSPSTTANYGDTVTVTCAPNVGYEVDTVTFNETAATGSGNNWTFSMPAADTTVAVTFKETLHTITVQTNDSNRGTVLRGTAEVSGSTTQIGYITDVTLATSNKSGYEFDRWTVTRGTATSMIVNGTTVALSGSTEQTITGATASSAFRFNGTAAVKAYFKPSVYSLDAKFTHNYEATWYSNSVATTDTDGVTKTKLNIYDYFEVRITLADGYVLDGDPTFISGTGYVSATKQSGPSQSGNVVTYGYHATAAGMITAQVTLKAATPSISNVQIKNTTFNFASPGNPTKNFYLQPTEVKAATQSFARLAYSNTGTSISNKLSDEAVSLAQPSVTLNAENATATYVLTITATNAPEGVDPAAPVQQTYTIQVAFNDAQKAYYKLSKLRERCVREETANNPYYKEGAPIATYNTAFDAAVTYLAQGYPAYNANSEATETANNQYNSFDTAYKNLMDYAKKTTVYVLTKIQNISDNPMYFSVYSNGSTADWNHFKMYDYGANKITDSIYKMSFTGTFVKDNINRYLYAFTFAGHMNFIVWRGTSAGDKQMDDSDKLTSNVTNVTDFKDYYINVYDTTPSSGASTTSAVAYVDFGHEIAPGKKYIEIGQQKTGEEIKSLFNITPVGSIVSSPGIDNLTTDNNIAFTIEGPGIATSLDLKTNDFVATKHGKYIVKYTTKFGKDGHGDDLIETKSMTLYVAFDDVTIYVDMNDNVGNPILNFKYFTDAQGNPASTGTPAYLPYEMDLVTGSESIYKYTVKTSKLKEDYKLAFDVDHPLNISYITVERTNINNGGNGFDILSDARITGEIWFKANSTHLTSFQTISCGSVTKSFVAVTPGGTVLTSAIDMLHGTGINTDEDEVYKSQYASIYQIEGAAGVMNRFHYVLNATAKQEAVLNSSNYYFDKWIVCPSSDVSYTPDNNMVTVSYPNDADDAGEDTALQFVSAPEYGDGDQDITYIALYKPVGGDGTVRVEITYKFQDYNTADGNYVYDANKKTVDASYTKTVKVTNSTMAAVQADLENIACGNLPYIMSNYFDYSFDKVDSESIVADENNQKIKVNAILEATAHLYKIILKNGGEVLSTNTGYYQQTVELASGGYANPVWKDSAGNIIGSGTAGSTFTARYVFSKDRNDQSTDCQIIKVENGTSTAAANKSVISNTFTEVYYTDSGTEMLRHNFYIIDYCIEGKLTGGGVLFATTDANDNYRQTNAGTVLSNTNNMNSYISGILNGDYAMEYKAQTIDNVGFRYKPFKDTEDVFRYSDDLKAYITMYEGSNVNSTNYEGQKLRVFSFMIYDNNGTETIVLSDSFAEVERYQPQS